MATKAQISNQENKVNAIVKEANDIATSQIATCNFGNPTILPTSALGIFTAYNTYLNVRQIYGKIKCGNTPNVDTDLVRNKVTEYNKELAILQKLYSEYSNETGQAYSSSVDSQIWWKKNSGKVFIAIAVVGLLVVGFLIFKMRRA